MENLENTQTDTETTQVEQVTDNLPTETQDTVAEDDLSQPVNNLDDAKRVLDSQSKKASLKKSSEKPNTQATIDYEKQYKELQKLTGSHSKELGELRKFYKENQQVIDSYKQFIAQQEETDMLAKYQENPTQVLKELARREAQAQIAPYQEQISQAQASNINSSIQQNLGADYETYAPVMAEMLDGFLEMDAAQGTNYATELANNPQVLVQLAAGKLALEGKQQQAQQNQTAQQTKANNLRIAQGVGKGSKTTSSAPSDFKSLSLDDMRAQMKAAGIIQ